MEFYDRKFDFYYRGEEKLIKLRDLQFVWLEIKKKFEKFNWRKKLLMGKIM